MLAQVSLTPTESKKLIAKAVARLEEVKKACDSGKVVIHPSSSTYFLVEELTGQKPQSNTWLMGALVPKGACLEMGAAVGRRPVIGENQEENRAAANPGNIRHAYVIRGGRFSQGEALREILAGTNPGW